MSTRESWQKLKANRIPPNVIKRLDCQAKMEHKNSPVHKTIRFPSAKSRFHIHGCLFYLAGWISTISLLKPKAVWPVMDTERKTQSQPQYDIFVWKEKKWHGIKSQWKEKKLSEHTSMKTFMENHSSFMRSYWVILQVL